MPGLSAVRAHVAVPSLLIAEVAQFWTKQEAKEEEDEEEEGMPRLDGRTCPRP